KGHVLVERGEDDPRRVELRRRRALELQDLERVPSHQRVEEEPVDHKEHRQGHVGDGRAEQLPELLARDDQGPAHARGASAASSWVTSLRKTSSRLIANGRSSSSPAPASTTVRAISSRRSAPSPAST